LRTPAGCGAVVMGCTEYELAAGQISAAMPGAALFGSAAAVAAQALRRAVRSGTDNGQVANGQATAHAAATQTLARAEERTVADVDAAPILASTGSLTVILSGRSADLPPAALTYRQGRELATLLANANANAGAGAVAGLQA